MASPDEIIAGLTILKKHCSRLAVGHRSYEIVAYSQDEDAHPLPRPDQISTKDLATLEVNSWHYSSQFGDWYLFF